MTAFLKQLKKVYEKSKEKFLYINRDHILKTEGVRWQSICQETV